MLLETEKNNTDLYYRWAKHNGLWDFIEDIIHPEHDIYGLRIATVAVKPPCYASPLKWIEYLGITLTTCYIE